MINHSGNHRDFLLISVLFCVLPDSRTKPTPNADVKDKHIWTRVYVISQFVIFIVPIHLLLLRSLFHFFPLHVNPVPEEKKPTQKGSRKKKLALIHVAMRNCFEWRVSLWFEKRFKRHHSEWISKNEEETVCERTVFAVGSKPISIPSVVFLEWKVSADLGLAFHLVLKNICLYAGCCEESRIHKIKGKNT